MDSYSDYLYLCTHDMSLSVVSMERNSQTMDEHNNRALRWRIPRGADGEGLRDWCRDNIEIFEVLLAGYSETVDPASGDMLGRWADEPSECRQPTIGEQIERDIRVHWTAEECLDQTSAEALARHVLSYARRHPDMADPIDCVADCWVDYTEAITDTDALADAMREYLARADLSGFDDDDRAELQTIVEARA